MDTKWKKSRAVAGFLAFILGISLLLGCAVLCMVRFPGWDGVRDVFQTDYQDTAAFQRYMEGYMDTFLGMDKKHMDRFHKTHKDDRNLLYAVRYNGKTLYTNWDATPQASGMSKLPAGYNFAMTFDGKKVTAQKDGEVLDIYGDGYYRKDSDCWRLPGYQNITVQTPAKDLYIVLAAAQTPQFYGTYSFEKNEYGNGELYWVTVNIAQNRKEMAVMAVTLGVAVVLLAVYFILRKDKKQADIAIAHVTGRLWLEVKLLAICVGFYVAKQLSYAGWGSLQTIILTATMVGFFGLLYLGVNDLRYNGFRSVLRQSHCGILFRSFSVAGLKLPVQKRLLRRNTALLILALLLAGLAGLGLLQIFRFTFYDGWHGILSVFVPAAGLVLLLFAPMVWMLWKNRKLIPDLGTLTDQISAVHSGDYSAPSYLPEDSDLRAASEQLSDIEGGMEKAIAERTKSERMKVELITNVSHDIKTPLTAIISYIELLKRQEDLSPEVLDYVRILDEKSQKLKAMVLDVFEVSKAAAGQLPVTIEELEFGKLLRQTLADMGEQIEKSGLTLKVELPEDETHICADGDRLYRVFQNLLQNALTYSLMGSRVFVTLTRESGIATAAIKNTSKSELASGIDFTQRFVRGDGSRTDGGSGLGLSIAKSFTEACGGSFGVEVDADLFTATVKFPVV